MAEIQTPPDWIKGCLLNVRNTGQDYVITLLGEEYDRHHPERAIRFDHVSDCQAFVSNWYVQEHHGR